MEITPPTSEHLGPLADVLALRAGLILSSGEVSAFPDDELLDLIDVFAQISRTAEAAQTVLAGEVARRCRPELAQESLCYRMGARNASELLERVCAASGRQVRARLKLGVSFLPRASLTGEPLPTLFPAFVSAVEAGALDADAVTLIHRTLTTIHERGADPDDIAAAEASLVGAASGVEADRVRSLGEMLSTTAVGADSAKARTAAAMFWTPLDHPRMTVAQVEVFAQAWTLALDPDGELPDDRVQMRRRGLTLGRVKDGTVRVTGELLPEVAAQLERLFDAYLNPKVEDRTGEGLDADASDGAETSTVAPPAVVADMRTPAQQRHDAFAGIITRAAGLDSMPLLGGAPPTLVVAATPDQLAEPHGVAFLQGCSPEFSAVPASVARHIGCSGAVQRIDLDARGRITGIDSPSRIFTAHQRRAIALRDGGCIIPGCTVRATWCEVHHVVEHCAGGPTSTDNGVLLCWYHHRTLDQSGWQILMVDGTPRVFAPEWPQRHSPSRHLPRRHPQQRSEQSTSRTADHRSDRATPHPDHHPDPPRPAADPRSLFLHHRALRDRLQRRRE